MFEIKIITFLSICAYVSGGGDCVMAHVWHPRGQLVGLGSIPPPCGFWNLNSGYQFQWQVPLPAEPYA